MKAGERRKKILFLMLLGGLFILSLALLPLLGGRVLSLGHIFSSAATGGEDHLIFWTIRLPRVVNGLIAGAGLAIAGMALQGLFRNPLAEPFTLGISAGAGLGAVIGIKLKAAFSFWGFSSISLFAFLGAAATVLMIYGLSRLKEGFQQTTLLLAGVAVNFFFLALIVFVQYLADFTEAHQMLRWMMGSLETVGFRSIAGTLPLVLLGMLIILSQRLELNLLLSGEELAESRGVEVRRAKLLVFLAASLITGPIVALCGPISFVGLIVPHILRLIIGADHLYLTIGSLLFGGVFLTCCDAFARMIIIPAEIPVGIITALLGGPFFLWLLFKK